ncbi:MAG: hypothetical protein ABJH04_08115 [Cyclobacteriaceae bacterium]
MSHKKKSGIRVIKFTEQKFERSPLSEIEKEVLISLNKVTFLPGSYDKRFFGSLTTDGHYTWKQKRYLHFIFNKYRRQIIDYQELAIRLEPDRFQVEVKFDQDLFSPVGRAEVNIKDTFKPRKLV